MNVLALDTSMGACSAAVLQARDTEPLTTRAYEPRARGHAEVLMPMIRQVMTEAALDFDDLDRIAVTVGPGTFTGVRIGVAAARGLALAAGLPLVGATSLAVMAQGALPHLGDDAQVLAVATDARRGQLYLALFDREGRALSDPQAIAADEAVELLPASHVAAAGSGASELADAAGAANHTVTAMLPDLQPDAADLARMALDLTPEDGPLRPLYLRPPDAKRQEGAALPWLS